MCASIITYSIAPRLLLTLVLKIQLRKSIQSLKYKLCKFEDVQNILSRLKPHEHRFTSKTVQPSNIQNNFQARKNINPSASKAEAPFAMILWNEAKFNREEISKQLSSTLKGKTFDMFEAGY